MRIRSHNNAPKVHAFQCITTLCVLLLIGCTSLLKKNQSTTSLQKYKEVSYYDNGTIEYEKLDGVTRHWSKESVLISESEYSNNKPHGIWKKYNNTNLIYQVHYFHGQKHGKEIWYYDNGQIKSEELFHYGKSTEEIMRWNSNGSIIY